MRWDERLAVLHGLDDRGWAQHANPWSGWLRFTTVLPLLCLAVWSRVWLGWWALGPVAAAVIWACLNPRAFGPAADDRAWITRGVLGERLWVARATDLIPVRHRTVPRVLAAGTTLVTVPLLVWGLRALAIWPTVVGAAASIFGKLWFCDRMALLYDDMAEADPAIRYRGTDRP